MAKSTRKIHPQQGITPIRAAQRTFSTPSAISGPQFKPKTRSALRVLADISASRSGTGPSAGVLVRLQNGPDMTQSMSIFLLQIDINGVCHSPRSTHANPRALPRL